MELNEIVHFFCQCNNVDVKSVLSRNRNFDSYYTRYMIWMYLHEIKGLSANHLSRLFAQSPRNIFRGIRIIKNEISIYKSKKDNYDSIVKEIEGMNESTPSDTMEEKRN